MPELDEFDKRVPRPIHLPLETLDKCSYCSKKGESVEKLSWCTSCAEVLYCSLDCQKEDWKSHKLKCGNTDRIDLKSFYPFIASVNAVNHINPMLANHPALHHQIINSPNPNAGEIVSFPNGAKAKMVLLGKKLPLSMAGINPKWWPTAMTDKVRGKFVRRIANEGNVLPILLATGVAMLSEIYTTTSSTKKSASGEKPRRVRLSYHRAPIADFGIIHGSAPVTAQDRLAYYNVENDTFMMGQDPDDHYWMYFTTLSGEELFLDCNMFTFNMCTVVNSSQYAGTPGSGLPDLSFVPAFFFDRDYSKGLPLLGQVSWKPRKKVSILRHPRLLELYRTGAGKERGYCDCHDYPVIYEVMQEIAGRKPSDFEKELVADLLPNTCQLFYMNVQNRAYLKYPKEPPLGIEADPGERIAPEGDEELYQYLRKWSRRLKQGKISPEKWEKAFKSWRENLHKGNPSMYGTA